VSKDKAVTAAWQQQFASILPVVERHARIAFRGTRCRCRREDAVAECVALSWKWFLRLRETGKDAGAFPTTLAAFAARAVRCGRRLCGQEPAKDALSCRAQRIHNFIARNEAVDALADDLRTPPGDLAIFRIDFAGWLGTLGRRKRLIVLDLVLGERTKDLAVKHKVSPGRISQIRRELLGDWHRFHGEAMVG